MFHQKKIAPDITLPDGYRHRDKPYLENWASGPRRHELVLIATKPDQVPGEFTNVTPDIDMLS